MEVPYPTRGRHVLNLRAEGGHTTQGTSTTIPLLVLVQTSHPRPLARNAYFHMQNNGRVLIDNLAFIMCAREPEADTEYDGALMYVWRTGYPISETARDQL